MTSEEERREVAARLRKDVGESSCIDYAVFRIAHEVLGIEHVTGAKAAHMLADLIDPTCEMEDAGDVPYSVKDSLSTFFCSECGSPIYNDMNPSYCIYCGARVVRVDE